MKQKKTESSTVGKFDALIEHLVEEMTPAIMEKQKTECEDARKLEASFKFFRFFGFAAP